MLGDSAPLREIAAVKREMGATLIVDEAHSLGTRGKKGRGVSEDAGVENEVDFIVGTFSKSLGAIGGFAVSDLPDFELLRIACRPYMFTASLPPAVVGSVTAALSRISTDESLGARVRFNSIKLYRALMLAGFEVGPEPNAIVALKMTDKETAVRFWNRLIDRGVYANLALPPATPGSLSLIRCSISAAHTEAQIDRALSAMVAVDVNSASLSQTRRRPINRPNACPHEDRNSRGQRQGHAPALHPRSLRRTQARRCMDTPADDGARGSLFAERQRVSPAGRSALLDRPTRRPRHRPDQRADRSAWRSKRRPSLSVSSAALAPKTTRRSSLRLLATAEEFLGSRGVTRASGTVLPSRSMKRPAC